LLDLRKEEWRELQGVLNKAVDIIKKTDKKALYTNAIKERHGELKRLQLMLKHQGLKKSPDAYNFGINDGEAAGRTVHHLHIHIIPRYSGDVKNPRGGIRNVFPELANYQNAK
jgi:histidine triad (HIT) family protein